MVIGKLDTWVTMGVLNRALIATLLGLLLFAVPSLGGETKDSKRHLKRGLKFEKQGRFEEALEQYSKAIELDRELAKAWFQRGVLYFRSDHFEEARSRPDKDDRTQTGSWIGSLRKGSIKSLFDGA